MMKFYFFCVLLITVFLVGCVKSIANKPENRNPNFHLKSTGSSAKDLLTDSTFQSLKIEIQYMKEAEPSDETLTNLKAFLTRHLRKPRGIRMTMKEIPSPQDTIYTLQRIMQLEDTFRTGFTQQDEIVVYVLFVNGYYYNQKLLGYAYRNTSVVVFGSDIKGNVARYKKHSRAYLESRVLQHEFGHLMGLVNMGMKAQNEHHDEKHEKHCTNKRCLMYYLVDTEDYPMILLRKEPPGFDKNCLEDLRANGGR